MIPTVYGHYDGKHIVMDEELPLQKGQRIIIIALEDSVIPSGPTKIDCLRSFMNKGPKLFEGDAQDYVRELRDNDRF